MSLVDRWVGVLEEIKELCEETNCCDDCPIVDNDTMFRCPFYTGFIDYPTWWSLKIKDRKKVIISLKD